MWFAFFLCLGVSLTASDDTISKNTRTSFNQMDSNKDGNLSPSEFESFFDNFDKDGDGHINLQEYTALIQMPVDEAKKRFDFYDINKDNDFTKADVALSFKDYDTNGDGEVSLGEFNRYAKASLAAFNALGK